MKFTTFRIWWSPVGGPNGSREVNTLSRSEALGLALEEMRRHNLIGAYGADEIKPQ